MFASLDSLKSIIAGDSAGHEAVNGVNSVIKMVQSAGENLGNVVKNVASSTDALVANVASKAAPSMKGVGGIA